MGRCLRHATPMAHRTVTPYLEAKRIALCPQKAGRCVSSRLLGSSTPPPTPASKRSLLAFPHCAWIPVVMVGTPSAVLSHQEPGDRQVHFKRRERGGSQFQIIHRHGCGVGVPGRGWPGDTAEHGSPAWHHCRSGESRQGPGLSPPGCPGQGQVTTGEGTEGPGTLRLPASFRPRLERPILWTRDHYLCVRNRHGADSRGSAPG